MSGSSLEWALGPEPKWSSLSKVFHEATFSNVEHDALARTLILCIQQKYPRPTKTQASLITLRVGKVSAALVFGYLRWPGPIPDVSAMDSRAREVARQDHIAKGWAETMSVVEFNKLIHEGDISIFSARAGLDKGLRLAFEGAGKPNTSIYNWSIEIAGETLVIERSDGSTATLTELVEEAKQAWLEALFGMAGRTRLRCFEELARPSCRETT